MTSSYAATYYRPDKQRFPATIYISAVTITIRYVDEANQTVDVYWLEKQVSWFDEKPGGTELQHLNNDGETDQLIITDPAAIQELKHQLRHNRLIGTSYHRALSKGWKKLAIFLGILIAIGLVAYFWVVPWLGERYAMSYSKEDEIRMGDAMYNSINSLYKVDEKKTELLNQFYRQLHYKVDYPVRITVVESSDVNAFAIPGGHIVVFDAILDKMKTSDELAALLGHEVSHVALRHSLRNMFRSLARKIFLALIVSDDTGIVSAAINNADDLRGLEYSRSLETEADNHGLRMMSESGLNPQGMVWLMELLKKESGSHEPSSLLSTHPVFTDRIRNIKEQIKALPPANGNNENLKKTFHEIYE